MSWLARGGKLKEKDEPESSPSQDERGVLVQTMLEHGGDPWDCQVLGQEPTLKAAEKHWLNYVSVYRPKGEKKCSALQWLLFDLARVLQAKVEEKDQCIQNLQSSLQMARNDVLTLRCDSSLLDEQTEQLSKLREELRAEAAENARLRSKVQCLGTLLSLGKGLDKKNVAAFSKADWDPEVRAGEGRSSEAQGEPSVAGEGAAGAGEGKPSKGRRGRAMGDRKQKFWTKQNEGWPLWVNRLWALEQCSPFTLEGAKRVVAAVGLPWPKVGAIIRALPAEGTSGGEILRLVIRNLGEYEPLKDNTGGAPWRDAQEASAYVCGNVLLRVLKQREKPVTPDFDILGVNVEQGDVGVLACRAPESHKEFFISLGSTLIGRPLGECMATLESVSIPLGVEGMGKDGSGKDGMETKRKKYIPRGAIWRYLLSQGLSESELDSQPTGVLIAKMNKIFQEKGLKQEEIREKLKQMSYQPAVPKRKLCPQRDLKE